MASYVPTRAVAPLVEAWLAGGGTLLQLSELTGVDPRTLGIIRGIKRPTLQAETADRLLCGIDRPDAWHTEPMLRAVYEG